MAGASAILAVATMLAHAFLATGLAAIVPLVVVLELTSHLTRH